MISREAIQDALEQDIDVGGRAVDMMISRLRQRLGDDPQSPRWVRPCAGAATCSSRATDHDHPTPARLALILTVAGSIWIGQLIAKSSARSGELRSTLDAIEQLNLIERRLLDGRGPPGRRVRRLKATTPTPFQICPARRVRRIQSYPEHRVEVVTFGKGKGFPSGVRPLNSPNSKDSDAAPKRSVFRSRGTSGAGS